MRSFVPRALGPVVLFMATFTACGGGGGGGGDIEPTPALPDVFYVRASGNDSNDGETPATAVRNIQTALLLANEGDMIMVGPGTYSRVDFNRRGGVAGSPIALDADPSGTMTGDAPGPVRIVINEGPFGIRLTGSPNVIIDGFTISGATANNAAGVIVRSSSHNVTIRNCELTDNTDGVRILDSEDVTVFNNLLFENRNRGVFIGASGAGAASSRARLINNTIVLNGGAGIFIGGNDTNASRDVFLQNNVVQNNEGRNIDVNDGPPSSGEGLLLEYNLVFRSEGSPECSRESPQSACGYGPFAPRGANDINADALFSEPNRQDFSLDQEDSPAIDASDPDLDPGLADLLRARTTSPRGVVDEDPIDLGYHAPQPEN
jgi:parallel beta-helix repeat protein